MARRFSRLSRPAIRKLRPGERVTESGITAECMADGDIRYTVAFTADGQRIHRAIGRESNGTTRTQAEEFISKTRAEAKEGRLSLPAGRKLHLTFDAAAELYLKRIEEIAAKDYISNEQHLRLHLRPYLGAMRLDRISVFTLEKFRNHCRDKGLSAATTNRVLATYRRMSRRLASWKVIPAPLPMLKLEKECNERNYVLSAAEEAHLLEAALADSNPYIWLFIKLGLATSLRHSEMLGARFEHFYAVKRRLRVKVKGGRWRYQPLTRGITEILQRERDMAEDRDGWIFPSKRSRTGHLKHMSLAFGRCVTAAKMDARLVSPHVLRHTAITRLAVTGTDVKTLQEFSGHESLAMVLRYAHAQDQIVNRALDKMEEGTAVEHPGVQKAQDS